MLRRYYYALEWNACNPTMSNNCYLKIIKFINLISKNGEIYKKKKKHNHYIINEQLKH